MHLCATERHGRDRHPQLGQRQRGADQSWVRSGADLGDGPGDLTTPTRNTDVNHPELAPKMLHSAVQSPDNCVGQNPQTKLRDLLEQSLTWTAFIPLVAIGMIGWMGQVGF
jgi:hypothetical protein